MRKQAILFVLLSLSSLLLCSPLVVCAQWEPDVRLTYNDSISCTSTNNAWCITSGPNNHVHVVWYDTRDGKSEIYYKHSWDGGLHWTADTRLSFSPDSSIRPAVAAADSCVYVGWILYRGGAPYICVKRSTDCGTTWGADTVLSSTYDQISLCLAASGPYVHLVWNYPGINYWRSTDAGVTWEYNSNLNGYDYPSITSHGLDVHLARTDTRTGYRDIFYTRSTDAGATWLPDVRLTFSTGDIRTPSIAATDSVIHVVWRESRAWWNVFYSRSTDGGLTWSPSCSLAVGIYPSVTASERMVHVVWEGRDVARLHYRRSTDAGLSWSSDTCLVQTPNTFIYPSICCSGSAVHVVWRDSRTGNYEIYYKRNPTGNSGVGESIGSFYPLTPNLSFSVIPNPFTSFARIPGHEADRFALYDISGRRVGVYKGDRIGEGLRVGVNFLRAESGKAKPVRIVKVR